MKKKVLAIVIGLSLFASGIAAASSQWGQYKGMEIVRVLVNGNEIKPEVPAHIKDGSTFLPLRAISVVLGAKVNWDGSTYTATVDMAKQELTQEAIERISKSVAKIYVYDANEKSLMQGSGAIIDDGVHGKILITACHVACLGPILRVEVNGQVVGLRNQVLFKNEQLDIFGVKIDTTAPSIPYVKSLPVMGEPVTEIGFPKGNYQVGLGQVLSVSEIMGKTMISSSVSADHGWSGGVTLNSSGELAGVVVMGDTNNNNQSVSLPMSYVQQELATIK